MAKWCWNTRTLSKVISIHFPFNHDAITIGAKIRFNDFIRLALTVARDQLHDSLLCVFIFQTHVVPMLSVTLFPSVITFAWFFLFLPFLRMRILIKRCGVDWREQGERANHSHMNNLNSQVGSIVTSPLIPKQVFSAIICARALHRRRRAARPTTRWRTTMTQCPPTSAPRLDGR